jgi:hypothetical protein
VALGSAQQVLEASSVVTAAANTITGEVVHRLVGAERSYAIVGRGQPAETLQVRPPRWAKQMEVDVKLSPDLWDEMTDFSITAYDSTGQQVRGGNEPMNYAFGRLSMTVPEELRGTPLTIELYPAFAKPPGHSWNGTAAIRFLGPDEPVGEGGAISVVAGGRAIVRLPAPPPLEKPEGFAALIETRITTLVGTFAARRTTVPRPGDGAR